MFSAITIFRYLYLYNESIVTSLRHVFRSKSKMKFFFLLFKPRSRPYCLCVTIAVDIPHSKYERIYQIVFSNSEVKKHTCINTYISETNDMSFSFLFIKKESRGNFIE